MNRTRIKGHDQYVSTHSFTHLVLVEYFLDKSHKICFQSLQKFESAMIRNKTINIRHLLSNNRSKLGNTNKIRTPIESADSSKSNGKLY